MTRSGPPSYFMVNSIQPMIDFLEHNRAAWNEESKSGESPWCEPVNESVIENARDGQWAVHLTPVTPVPASWFNDVRDKKVLCLASGGGQQAPVLAAAGGIVTSFDISDEQLAKDNMIAERDGLDIELVQGDMTDLSRFDAGQFDLIFHPTSNVFVKDVRIVWLECFRVLDTNGRLLSGFMNPDYFLFDHAAIEAGESIVVCNQLPFSEVSDSPKDRLQARVDKREALMFSHSLNDQIGGQIDAGLVIAGLYEDRWSDEATRLNAHMPTSIATLAIKR
jgi:SAM-dependent methyltransferase